MTAKKRTPYDPQRCDACVEYCADNPSLVGACASVGIEHGWSTAETLVMFLRQYHERGHPREARP